MKRFLLLFFLLLSPIAWAQEKSALVTLSFEKSNMISVLAQIEGQTGYRFYYIDSWLQEYNDLSGDYKDTELTLVLKDLFDKTIINFYVLDDTRIILTQHDDIYDYLPDYFFGGKTDTIVVTTTQVKKVNPVFAKTKKASGTNKIETVKIGKITKNNTKETYSLSGYVKNAQTGKPLSKALILINGNDRNIKTDVNGFYTMDLSTGVNMVEIDALGMESFKKRIILYNDGTYNVTLDEKVEQLDEVFIQKKTSNNVEEVVTKTVIDVKESKNIPLALGERDVLKVATSLPGITTTGEGAIGYNVRGGKSDQNLILLDNAVIYSPQHFFGIFSALNPFVLKDANIYKNNIPAEYGGRLSSVFDLTTKDASVDTFKGEASIGAVTGNILLETPIVKEKSGLLIGGRGAYANWILESLDDESLKNSEASFYDVVAKYNHQISDKSKIQATAYLSRDDFSITSDSLYVYNNRAISLKWDYEFNDRNRGKLFVSNSQYKFDIEFDGESNDDFNLGYSIDETQLKFLLDHDYNDKIKFDYGLSSKLYTINPGKIEPLNQDSSVALLELDKEKALESAVFLTAKVDLTNEIKLDAGIRYSVYNALGKGTQNIYQPGVPLSEETIQETKSFDENEIIKTYGGPEFRISGRYLFAKDFSVKASYNKTFQFIHSLSNNTTASPIDTWKLSDLNIKPQSSQQYALGLYKNLNEDTYELSLEGFYKRLDDIVDFKTGAQILLNENIETQVLQGEGKAYGAELLIKKQKGKLYGWLGYTYSRTFNKFDSSFNEEKINNGNFFPANFDKPHDFSLVLNYKFTKRFSLATNFVYQTGRPITYPVGRFIFNGSEFTAFSDRNKFRIPDYYRLDLGFNIEGNHKKKKLAHSFWTISIYNVLGRNNPFSIFFVSEEGRVKGFKSSIFSIPVPSITYNFKF